MGKIKMKTRKYKVLAVGGSSCYGVFIYKDDYDKAKKYIHGDYRYQWFYDIREAYNWAILTFMKFNRENYAEFEYYELEDLLKRHIAFPYSERMRELDCPAINEHNLL